MKKAFTYRTDEKRIKELKVLCYLNGFNVNDVIDYFIDSSIKDFNSFAIEEWLNENKKYLKEEN